MVKEGWNERMALFTEVQNARDRKERNKEWNMKVIEAMSKVDGTEVMNRVR